MIKSEFWSMAIQNSVLIKGGGTERMAAHRH
ncbi:MAG: hypothetical protein QOD31_3544 [Pseudonocardiales bacterium]|jgi:hypothetical protein|nr:hypothetical protein [Pseudonocardiales bacterium]